MRGDGVLEDCNIWMYRLMQRCVDGVYDSQCLISEHLAGVYDSEEFGEGYGLRPWLLCLLIRASFHTAAERAAKVYSKVYTQSTTPAKQRTCYFRQLRPRGRGR